MMRHLRQLASESLVYGLSGMIVRFLAIFLVPLYTRIFTPEDYGVLSLVTTTMAVVNIFVVLALDNSAHRWYWETEDEGDRKRTLASWAWCQLGTAMGVALVMAGLSGWLARTVVGRDDAAPYFVLAALSLPLSALGTVVVNWLRMQRRPWATMSYTLATSLANILLTVLLVVGLGWGLGGIFAAQVMAAALGTAAAVWMLRSWVSPRHVRWERLREMLRFAVPLIPAALAFWVVNLSDRYFVQYYASTTEVGLYAVGSALAAVVAMITNAFQQAWGPFALSIHKQDDAKQVYAHVLTIYMWLTCLASAALTILAPEALQLLATESYVGAADVVAFLTLSYVMIGLGYIASVGTAIVKTNAPTGVAVTVAAALNIALNIVLVPSLGKTGAAVATLISQSVVPVYIFFRAQQLYPIPYRFGPPLGILVLTVAVMALGTGLRVEGLWLAVGLKLALLVLFLPALPLLGVITLDQARGLLRSVRARQPA